MSDWVPVALRRLVAERAQHRCEYCLFPEEAAWLAFEIEHIIAKKHRGQTIADNLALACPDCNRFKGSDISSLDPKDEQLTPLFNPRTDNWQTHFRISENGQIKSLSGEGRVTELILRFNLPERVADRHRLMVVGQYP